MSSTTRPSNGLGDGDCDVDDELMGCICESKCRLTLPSAQCNLSNGALSSIGGYLADHYRLLWLALTHLPAGERVSFTSGYWVGFYLSDIPS